MLAHAKHFLFHYENRDPSTFWKAGGSRRLVELCERVVFIVGLGSIGQEIAGRCKGGFGLLPEDPMWCMSGVLGLIMMSCWVAAFGMTVYGARRRVPKDDVANVDKV